MKRYFQLSALILGAVFLAYSCQQHKQVKKPRLVVGIVVDQMRWDYLYRYSAKYGPNGFKRLLKDGYSCENTHINYLPTYTGPGHTCVYTGSVPAIHGIAGNGWYDRQRGTHINCVDDSTVGMIGTGTPKGKQVSPNNLLVTTITDELKIANNNHSKVVSLALKDRSAILPGGHNPNGAYFVDGGTGNFVTTSYYTNQLPAWVDSFNDKKLAQKYLALNWKPIDTLISYTESTDDDEPYERPLSGEAKPVFPHQVGDIAKQNLDILAFTPYGNTITLDFAKAAIEGEKLGSGTNTDFLAISLSSTDLIGHTFGPNSVEIEDCYRRLDIDLGNFFTYLDAKLGKDNYVIFLTADHGVAHAGGYMKNAKMPAGSFQIDTAVSQLNAVLEKKFAKKGDWILSHENMQLYINYNMMDGKISRADVFETCKQFLMQYNGVANVVDLQSLANTTLPADLKNVLANGYNYRRSGDFQILYNSGWFEDFSKGATHGTFYNYDTHIPLVWMGWQIRHGQDHNDVHMTDIAPTLAALLHIQEPSGSIGKPIIPVVGK